MRFLHRRGFLIRPGEFALLDGASGGLAVTLMVVLALVSPEPQAAWGAYAAFWTCLADNRAAPRSRLCAMAIFALSGTFIAVLVAASAVPGSLGTGIMIAALVSLCIYLGSLWPGMANVGVLTAVVAVVAAEQPARISDAPGVAMAFVCGGGLALLLRMASLHVLEKADLTTNSLATNSAHQRSHGWRKGSMAHAGLSGATVLITYMAAHGASLLFPQWATMAAVVVTNMDARTSWPRTLERVLGSIFGGAVAFLVSAKLSQPTALIWLVLPLATATIALRAVNYTLFVVFLTPLFVVVTELVFPEAARWAAGARTADNIVGSLVALAACLSFLLAAASRKRIRTARRR
ncbi:FUSC family protein [Bradyrhizobium sp. SZCCHNS2006]|uniref:FUSC family protein n=1 Tax=Bradyrhizobium sp. SZCCHNS2006 TaxID=3057304 RepID=UPI002916F965|nr:FUSC family protein [Bradyrhizobium sp. SZCCHNS2006]